MHRSRPVPTAGVRIPRLMLGVFLVVAALVWAFVELADEVVEGSTRAFDEALLLAMRSPGDNAEPLGPLWLEEMARDWTALGGVAVLSLLVAAVTGFLWLGGQRRSALFLLLAVAGGLAVSTGFKEFFDRPRPDLVSQGSYVYTASFPSGHSLMAAMTYLTLALMLTRAQPHRRIKVYILAVALVATVLVGVSRVYLGVHWPSDVLAGWTAGAAWALLAWALARYLDWRGTLEPERDEDDDPRPEETGL
ncbi:phosphatase PAP2 family protein [Rhodobacteraceae bacterium 2CG4]|uniref:Phosphatase PAP2 family protein n=1 Tax=Halovulum marinum TaxID=2662447 RepID=A0A6L5Z246_9RHOB|nr:phosphatase PAP2 family protein [Halovulum marinum]MSU90150.1 phosphatase PAP2 family protein [Halovulum marinum]